MLTNVNQKLPESCSRFYCDICNYKTDKKSSFNKHLLTAKHLELTRVNQKLPKSCSNKKYSCSDCLSSYNSRVGLWKHKKICTKKQHDNCSELITPPGKLTISEDLLFEFIKQNNELKELLVINNNTFMELAKEGKTINNNTQNNFNLNIFLNETCKDAMNISDFIDSIKVELEDLEITGQIGYAEGLSRIFINNLNDLHIHKRPIHCSNLRNEVLYIKNDGEWIKEDEKRTHITNALKHIGHKHMQQIYNWQKKYPDFSDPSSKHNDKYNKLICNVMSGSTIEEQSKNINKIIKNVIKHAVIDKK